MGKSWDTDKGGRDNWIKWMQEVATECKRVLKPGGHAFVWAIPRTSHWTATAWENAGFEIRDVVAHVFGSGFPKSHNIGKNIEKIKVGGIKNLKQVGTKKGIKVETGTQGFSYSKEYVAGKSMGGKQISGDIPVYEINNEYEGWGTALKPAREDWILMRKPLEKGLNIAQNCLKWGVGGINIDGCRISHNEETKTANRKQRSAGWNPDNCGFDSTNNTVASANPTGRFPANLIHDGSEEVVGLFPQTKGGGSQNGSRKWKGEDGEGGFGGWAGKVSTDNYISRDDGTGSASRFFYCAKASKSERNMGCEELEEKEQPHSTNMRCGNCGKVIFGGVGNSGCECVNKNEIRNKAKNHHPTVKPIALMEYLIKLVSREGQTVLDPFAGSFTTGIACINLDRKFIGIERDPEYFKIGKARIDYVIKKKSSSPKSLF
jgi:DNA modification methylase